jgi:hypothetical protein
MAKNYLGCFFVPPDVPRRGGDMAQNIFLRIFAASFPRNRFLVIPAKAGIQFFVIPVSAGIRFHFYFDFGGDGNVKKVNKKIEIML